MKAAVDLSSSYSSSRVVVTGASGFIGARLCHQLCLLGAEVIAVSRRERTEPHSAVPESVQWRTVCFDDEEDVCSLVRETEPDIIFHGSGMAHGQPGLKHVVPSLKANLLSMVNFSVAAAQYGNPAVVLMGSMEEPDLTRPNAVPTSPYAASKEACNTYAKLFSGLYQVPTVNCRLFMTYGPGQYYVRKLIPYVIMSLANGQVPRLRDGRREIDWVFVDDVVEGLLRSACIEKKTAQRVDIGSGRLVKIRDLVEIISRIMDASTELSFGEGEALKGKNWACRADIAATKKQLGWAPSTSLKEGLEKTVRWYCDHKDLFQDEWKTLHE